MKKALCFLFLLSSSLFFGQNLTINGSSDGVSLDYCNSTSVDVNFLILNGGTYNITLKKNGSVFSTITKTYTASGMVFENLFYSTTNTLSSGQYQCEISNLGAFILTNTVTAINPNPYVSGTYLQCSGDENNFSNRGCSDDIQVYEFVPNVLLVVMKNAGLIYKVKKTGGGALNMFNINNDPQYDSHVLGYQNFNKAVTAIDYSTIDNRLLVGFEDGKVLTINGLGGTGQNMFAVNEFADSFSTVVQGNFVYPFYAGHHKFDSGITEIKCINGKTFICLTSGKVLKVNGSGGTGANVFAIEETLSGFNGFSNYSIYVGDTKFKNKVIKIFSNNFYTFFAFSNGKLLKINNVGGSGHNMFAIGETTDGFNGIQGWDIYVGHAKFIGNVVQMEFQSGKTTLGFSNGKLLKINGIGGSGQNMFAVEETLNDFSSTQGWTIYLGHAKYSSSIKKIFTIPSGEFTFVTLENGKLMKINYTGGTGANMYNATEDSGGFHTTSNSYAIQLKGSSNFETAVTDIDYIPSTKELLLSFSNLTMFKTLGYGGSGYNCFNVAQTTSGFYPLYGYSQFTVLGTQVWSCRSKILAKNTQENVNEIAPITDPNDENRTPRKPKKFTTYPNPTNGVIVIEKTEMDVVLKTITVYDTNNIAIMNIILENENSQRIDLTSLRAGIYLMNVETNEGVFVEKIVKN